MMDWTSIGLYAEMQQRLTPIAPLVTLYQVLPSAYAVKNIKQRNIVLRVVIHYAKKVHPRRLLVSNCALSARFACCGSCQYMASTAHAYILITGGLRLCQVWDANVLITQPCSCVECLHCSF
jgi:hypothetical protein